MNKIKFVNQSDLYTAVLEIWAKACDRFMVKGYIRVQPTANSLTYTGVAQALCTAGIGSGTIVYSLDGSTYTTAIPSQTNAGTYTVYYKALSSFDSTESPVYTLSCGIDKATPTVVVPTAKVLTYNGSAQELLNAGSTDLGTLKYSLDNSTWSTSIPTATNGGSYTAYYKVEGDSNINDVASTSVQCSINEKQPTITIELSQDTYTYDGTAKTPTVTVKDGSTTINPSEYTVTYSNNTNAGTATVTITDNVGGNYNVVGSTTFTINKANRTLSWTSLPNNIAPGSTGTLAATPSAGSGDGTITYSSSNTSIATISGTTVTAVSGGSCTITATISAGTNYNSATTSYTLTVKYPNGIYAAYADGSMRTAATADTNAIGVAVITNNCKFIIDKTNATGVSWDTMSYPNGKIAGCFTTDDSSTAKTNYTGVSNTNAIAAVAEGGEAAKYCRSCSKTIAGKTVYGYLGACGEWQTAYDNKTTVDSIMSIIGGTSLANTWYWTSTLSVYFLLYYYEAWIFEFDNGGAETQDKDNPYFARPFYEIS